MFGGQVGMGARYVWRQLCDHCTIYVNECALELMLQKKSV